MSQLANAKVQLLETIARIDSEERALAAHPEHAHSVAASIRSLEKVRKQLETEFAEAASRLGRDICKYRIFSDDGEYRLPTVASAVLDFQSAITTAYDAIKNGPKERARAGVDSVRESSFEVAYTLAGSLTFALVIPNDRLPGVDAATSLDQAVSAVCELASARDPAAVSQFARRLGNATIRSVRKWAEWHAKTGLGAEIRWMRGSSVRAKALVQPQELHRLQEIIDHTSDEQTATVEVCGTLQKVDMVNNRFALEVPDTGELLEGKFETAIEEGHFASVPQRYRAVLVRTVRTRFALEKDEESYFLESLTPLS